jgi:hypothetical protein
MDADPKHWPLGLHRFSVGRDIEAELTKSPKMVSNVQQLMFIGENPHH